VKKQQVFYNFTTTLLGLAVVVILIFSLYKSNEPVSVVYGNTNYSPLEFELKQTNDTISKMLIRDRENSCEVVLESGATWFFAEPADMVLWLKDRRVGEKNRLWVYTIDTKRWIEARIAWYGIRDKTVMGYGFGAREVKTQECIDYESMSKRVLHGETLLNPRMRKHLLEDNYDH